MRPCIIDFDQIKKWKEYVVNHEITLEEIMRIANKEAKYVGDRPEYVLYVDVGYRFVHSIENVPSLKDKSVYKIRRLSGSIPGSDKFPSIPVMQEISSKLGFGDWKNCSFRLNSNDPIPNIEIVEVISIS